MPADERVYAIGDIHGEAALLERLLVRILDDSRRRGPATTTLVLLGDVIDRGVDAAGLLLALARIDDPRVVLLKGNHEAALVDCYRGDEDALGFWLEFGGRSTLAGFGIGADDIAARDGAGLIALLQSRLDPAIIDWIDRLPSSWSVGDYYFAHAGVRPGLSLDRQDEEDLRWIREPFLSSPFDHGKTVVHGHTIEPGVPRMGGNRIGIDTGAHEHGRLTALGLEGDRQWIVQATARSGAADAALSERGARAAGTAADRSMFDAIARLISAITADVGAKERPLLLRPEWTAAVLVRAKGGWARPAAAMAIAAVVGAALFAGAYRPGRERPDGDIVAMGVPGVPAAAPYQPPVRVAPEAPDPPAVAVSLARPRDIDRPVARPTEPNRDTDAVVSPAASAAAVHLTGATLERALAEDRIATRRLNEAELARIERER